MNNKKDLSKCENCGKKRMNVKYTKMFGDGEFLCPECRGDWDENIAVCLECGKEFIQSRDIQLCEDCIKLFDLDDLWRLHDDNKINALDFNERKSIRERFRIKLNRSKNGKTKRR